MKRVDVLRDSIIHLLEVQIKKMKKANKAHQVIACVDWLDQELFDKVNLMLWAQQEHQYFEKNSDLDKWFDQEIKENKK